MAWCMGAQMHVSVPALSQCGRMTAQMHVWVVGWVCECADAKVIESSWTSACIGVPIHGCMHACVCVHGCQGAWVHRCMGTCVKLHGCISACGVGVRGCRGAWPHEAPRGGTKARGAPPRGPGGAPHSRFTRVGGINLRKIKKTGKIRIGKGGLGQTPQVITTKPRGAPPRGPGGAPHSRFTRMGGHTPRKNRKIF